MTVWRSSGCNAENGYGIRRDRSVRQRVQKSHDSPSRYKGYLKSALVSGATGWVTDIPERGARLRRRDDGEYREYARDVKGGAKLGTYIRWLTRAKFLAKTEKIKGIIILC